MSKQGTILLVCGGRHWRDKRLTYKVLDRALIAFDVTQIIVGGAPGADKLAADWAEMRNVKCRVFNANWERQGKAAGPIRNQKMLDEGKPHMALAFPGGRGTADMIKRSRGAGLLVWKMEADKTWKQLLPT